MQVFYLEQNIPFLAELLSPFGKIVNFSGRELTNPCLIEDNCTALFVRSTTIVNEELLKGTSVAFVATATTGTDHVDTEYLSSKNIVFSSAFGSNANSVAEYVLYSMLKWADEYKFMLKNKILGIVGFGNIGSRLAYYASKLEMKILVNDPPLKEMNFAFPDYVEYCSLEDLARHSDIFTNHVPLTKTGNYPTEMLINGELLNLLRDGSLLIHTSRGGVLDEAGLLSRISAGDIDAVIDVWENEPLVSKPLAESAFIATAHIAGYSYDGKVQGAVQIAKDYLASQGSSLPSNSIDKMLNNETKLSFGCYSNQEQLLSSLKKSRDIDSDSVNYKNTLMLSSSERANAFDQLRKNYPIRREILTPFV